MISNSLQTKLSRIEKPSTRAKLKAQTLANLKTRHTFPRAGIKYVLTDIRLSKYDSNRDGIIDDQDGDILTLNITATNKKGESLPTDNPYHFVNPPIMVPDGTKGKLKQPDGSKTKIENFVENPLKALEQIVIDAVGEKS